jgi:hypothetical protein
MHSKTLQQLLPVNHADAPRKKFRHKKRYIRQILAKAAQADAGVSDSSWYYHSHYHADWRGHGNLGWRMRAVHLKALSIVFARYTEQLANFNKPYELLIYLDGRTSAYDAVYVNSPNPYGKFPTDHSAVKWGIPALSEYFESLLPGYKFRAGKSQFHDPEDNITTTTYYIYSPGIGVSLESSPHA